MKDFLNKKMIFETQLEKSDVLKRLAFQVEPKKTLKYNIFGIKTNKPYIGSIENDTFKINRMEYDNRWSYEINGVIKEIDAKLIIEIELKPTSLSYFVFYVFIFFLIISILPFFMSFSIYSFILPSIFTLFLSIFFLGHLYETNITKKNFKKFFRAELM